MVQAPLGAKGGQVNLGLAGKVAWVTGASAGLGYASALSLSREGAQVAISARRESLLKQCAGEIEGATGNRCLAVPLEVGSAEDVELVGRRIAEELGPVDILVSNGGGPPPGRIEDFSDDDVDSAFELLTASAWRLTKAVLPDMRKRRSGSIIYVTSGAVAEPIENLSLSTTMRAAVTAMAKNLSREAGVDGVRVLCVAPMWVETERVKSIDSADAKRTARSPDEVRLERVAEIALKRYGRPEEFGDVVAFLASDRASFLTGITVAVDGGTLATDPFVESA